MEEIDQIRQEINRLRRETSHCKEQCARVEERERALTERIEETEARLRQRREELKASQALEAELRRYVRVSEQMLSQEQAPGRDSTDSAGRGDAAGE